MNQKQKQSKIQVKKLEQSRVTTKAFGDNIEKVTVKTSVLDEDEEEPPNPITGPISKISAAKTRGEAVKC